MRTPLSLLILVSTITIGLAQADRTADRLRLVSSPDHPRTFAYGEMIWHQLFIDPATQTLAARITFSNLPYAGSPETRVDEPFDFHFPNTQIDRATGTVFVRDRNRSGISLAHFRGNPTNGCGDLAPGTKIYLIKKSGRMTALLTATTEPRPGMRWIQMNDNWSLQNLLASLWNKNGN